MLQKIKRKRVTKPIRVDKEWHYTLKIEATNKNTSMSNLLEKIVRDYFFQLRGKKDYQGNNKII